MLRHRFQPGRLIAGTFLLVAGVAYAGDASDAWETPWYVIIPIVSAGLLLAALAGIGTYALRRRSDRRREQKEATEALRGPVEDRP